MPDPINKMHIDEAIEFAAGAAKSVLDITVPNVNLATGRRVIMTVSISVDPQDDDRDGMGNTCVVSNVPEMVVCGMMTDYIEQVLTDRLVAILHKPEQQS